MVSVNGAGLGWPLFLSMEKREITIERKKEQKPVRKRKRKSIGKKLVWSLPKREL